MNLSKTAKLDERMFRCAAYAWVVQIHRVTTLPPENPQFESPSDAEEYFKKVRRVFTVIDENVSGSESIFSTWDEAWLVFCKTINGYAKFFPMVSDTGDGLYSQRYDLPDPLTKELN